MFSTFFLILTFNHSAEALRLILLLDRKVCSPSPLFFVSDVSTSKCNFIVGIFLPICSAREILLYM